MRVRAKRIEDVQEEEKEGNEIGEWELRWECVIQAGKGRGQGKKLRLGDGVKLLQMNALQN